MEEKDRHDEGAFDEELAGVFTVLRRPDRSQVLELLGQDVNFNRMDKLLGKDRNFSRDAFSAFQDRNLADKDSGDTSEAHRTYLGLQVSDLVEDFSTDISDVAPALQSEARIKLFRRIPDDPSLSSVAEEIDLSSGYFYGTDAVEQFKANNLIDVEGSTNDRSYSEGEKYGEVSELLEDVEEEIWKFRVAEGWKGLGEDFIRGIETVEHETDYFPSAIMGQEAHGLEELEDPTQFHYRIVSELESQDLTYRQLMDRLGWTRSKIRTNLEDMEDAGIVEVDGETMRYTEKEEDREGMFRDHSTVENGKRETERSKRNPQTWRNTRGNTEEPGETQRENMVEKDVEKNQENTGNGTSRLYEFLDGSLDSIDAGEAEEAIEQINENLEVMQEDMRISRLADGNNWAVSLENNYELQGDEPPEDAEYVIFETGDYSAQIPGFRGGKALEYFTEEELEEAI
ncbi:MAG: winged helix-turn-helix domain-containing protein [Candidatus Nanosalina sp.]